MDIHIFVEANQFMFSLKSGLNESIKIEDNKESKRKKLNLKETKRKFKMNKVKTILRLRLLKNVKRTKTG